jgi:nitrogen-specific signal transduction histidine kinase/ActR/RegA family two-component response regulator
MSSVMPATDLPTALEAGSARALDPDIHLRQAQKMEVVGRLAGGVAHDFNNLLTVILGYSDLLISNLAPGEPQREGLEEIRRAAERAAELTRQLLAFSRQQVLELRIVDVNRVVAGLERVLLRLIGEHIELRTHLDPYAGSVRADVSQLEVVILNLAINARDAMPQGGRLIIETSDVELDQGYVDRHLGGMAGRYVLLSVSDTGVGMDDVTKAHLFEPFYTTKERGKGTGLGLATVYGIVKQFGGCIWAYSEVNHGTTFKIYLPRASDTAVIAESGLALSDTPRGTETILLVEDEEAVRHLAQRVLEVHGYTVLAASNGPEAVAIYQWSGVPIHLLVTDVVMPQMSGRELADKLSELGPPPRVLFCSGYTDTAIVEHGILDADTAFLQKPFTPDGLVRKVRAVLDSTVQPGSPQSGPHV